MKKVMTLIAVSAIALSMAACTNSRATDKAPGTYKQTHKSTNAYGTETTQKKETEVYYDRDGNKKARVETETTKDPEGLMNKSKSKTTTVVQ